ncbi:MAG: tetratricopeptide repeat protein, partial [Candidatus Eremiobacteraeota bacterium]|nr:tetratricopeptide repeat protein [Candidatus Eremiobacteraeota bacterium]
EIHLAAGSRDKAVQEFLEGARLYAESDEESTVIEIYRTVLRVDSDNSKALNALHSIGLQKGEDLTINLFPPMEETSTAPDEEETRPHPVNPHAAETDQGFKEMNLVEEPQEEKAESRASDFLPSRPALVPKSGLVKAGGGKPTFGSPRSGRPLREGLVSRGSTGKGSFTRGATKKSDKPFFVREEPAPKAEVPQTVEPEAIVEPAVLPPLQPETADPIVENLTPVEIEPEPAPEVAVGPVSPDPEAPPILEDEFGFESIFEGVDSLFEEPALSSGEKKPLDIPAFTEVFEEPTPEPVNEVDVPEDVPEDSIFDFNFDMEEETKPFVLFDSETEIDEPVDSGSEHIEDPVVREESDELITPGEDESEEIVGVDESLIDVPVDAGVLFPTDEPLDSIFDFDKDWMEPVSEEVSEPEESLEVEQVPVAEAVVEEIDELDSSWLFPPEESSETVQPPADEVALVEPAEERVILEPALVECKEDSEIEDPMPTFEWELDFETPEEPEASPLFPEVAEPVEADDSLEYERLLAVEISKLAREDELTVETPELSRILEDTLPQTVQAEVVQEEEEEEQEPETLVEEATVIVEETPEPVVSEFEIPEEAADVATRIESFRQRLVISPTDESAALSLADTCLRYGLLEEALQHYRRVQKANPSCLETSSRIIKAALWMEDVPTVKAELWKAARLSFDLGDLKACQERLGDLLSLDREHKEARLLMVEVFLAGGQEKLAAWHLGQMVERAIGEQEYDLAINSLKRLNDISPSDAALERLGELYQKQHRLDEALEIFRTLRSAHLSREELQDAVRLARQVVDLESQRTDDREVLIELLSRNGSNSEVIEEQLELAKLYRQNDQTQQAVELLQTLLQEDPSHLDAERLLVELHLQTGSLDLAEQHAESLAERFLEKKAYQKAINLFEYWVGAAPASARARERLAQFYQLNGDLDGAKMEWLMVTESHQAAGDFQRAARSLERALELDPQQVEWRLRLAQLKAQELGQVESALQDLRLLFQADPSWRKATVCYLDLLMEQSRMAELGEALQAVEHLTPGSDLKDNVVRSVKEKMTREPDNLELAFGWGELCLALGLLDLAIEQFQRLRRHERYQLHSYRLLGLCFSQKKGFNMVELALSQFKRGLALEGQTPEDRLELQYARACVLSDHGRND